MRPLVAFFCPGLSSSKGIPVTKHLTLYILLWVWHKAGTHSFLSRMEIFTQEEILEERKWGPGWEPSFLKAAALFYFLLAGSWVIVNCTRRPGAQAQSRW